MLPQVAAIHYTLTLVMLVAGAIAIVRGVMLLVGRRAMDGWLQWPLVLVLGAGVVQSLLGLVLLVLGARPADPRHYLWALAVVGAIPFAYSFVRRRAFVRSVVVLTLAAVVIVVAGSMALLTGCPFLGGCPH